jgi:hypothetical protein
MRRALRGPRLHGSGAWVRLRRGDRRGRDGDEPAEWGIAGKVNWIGLGPHEAEVGKRGPLVTFDHFLQFGADGPELLALAPKLAGRMYANNVRCVIDDVDAEQRQEIAGILALAKNASPSRGDRAEGSASSDATSVVARGPAVRKGGG